MRLLWVIIIIIIIIRRHAPCQYVALLATNSLHSDLSKASSIASSKVSCAEIDKSGHPGGVGAPSWPTPIAVMDTSQNPPGVSCLVYSGQMAKQHESSFLYNSREGRLFYYGCPDYFRESVSTPAATFAEIVPIDPMNCVQNLKFVALPIPEITQIRGYSNHLGSPWIRPRSLFSQIFHGLLFG